MNVLVKVIGTDVTRTSSSKNSSAHIGVTGVEVVNVKCIRVSFRLLVCDICNDSCSNSRSLTTDLLTNQLIKVDTYRYTQELRINLDYKTDQCRSGHQE